MTKIHIINGVNRITLPITPESFEVTDAWSNEELNINQLGLITMIGKRGLKSVTISSFLPKIQYEFVVPGSAMRGDNWGTIKNLQEWRGKVLKFAVSCTEGIVSWSCVIDGDFTYGQKDGSGDIYYTITFKEYKHANAKRTVKKPEQEKPASANGGGLSGQKKTYTTKKGDTINKISKNLCGSTKKSKSIYNKNKNAIKKAFKKYMKTLSSSAKSKYKSKSKYNRPLPKGLKLQL